MKHMIFNTFLVVVLAGCNDSSRPGTNSTPVATDTENARRDNTEVNVRDRSDAVKTPIDQNENQNDIDITANIRKRVVDTHMSVNAQNVKIITQDGKVTSARPSRVRSTKKIKLKSWPRKSPARTNVVNQLEVQP